MDYQVIPDFLYLNEPIYRRVDGVPQARLVSSGIGHAVNVEPANQHGVYPWTPDNAAGPASTTNAAGAAARARASEPDIITQLVPHSTPTDNWINRRRISRADGERLIRVSYNAEGLRSVLDPANANRVYYSSRGSEDFLRLGTLVRHFLRSGETDIRTQFFFSNEPDRPYQRFSLYYDPLPDVPTTAPPPSIGLPTQGGYKRSTTSRNKKKHKLIRRTRRQNRSRK